MALRITKEGFINIETINDEEDTISLDKSNNRCLNSNFFKENNEIKRIELYNIERICMDAFLNCKELEEIIIPASLKEIEANAFKGCNKLANIVVDEEITEVEYIARVFNHSELRPFESLLKHLKEGYRVRFITERNPSDDNWL